MIIYDGLAFVLTRTDWYGSDYEYSRSPADGSNWFQMHPVFLNWAINITTCIYEDLRYKLTQTHQTFKSLRYVIKTSETLKEPEHDQSQQALTPGDHEYHNIMYFMVQSIQELGDISVRTKDVDNRSFPSLE